MKNQIRLPKTFVKHLIDTVEIFKGVEFKESKSYFKVDRDNPVVLEIYKLAVEQHQRDEQKMHLRYNWCNKIHYGAERLRRKVQKTLPNEIWEPVREETLSNCYKGKFSETFMNTLKAITPERENKTADNSKKKIVTHQTAQGDLAKSGTDGFKIKDGDTVPCAFIMKFFQ
mgnify:CR=1 FL=1|tara:strand:+ start:1767 stop:2279 length:513 start_codon:yes stop_codon:yes gene_type:complete